MKPTLIFVAGIMLAINAKSQSIITGPVTDASGLPASCTLSIRPTNVPGASTTTINYIVAGGDLTGSISGYGASIRGPLRNAPLQLLPGIYSAFISCLGGMGSRTYTWKVPPGGSITFLRLNLGGGRTFGEMTTVFGSTPGVFGDQ